MDPTTVETLQARSRAHASWANTSDPSARTEPGRAAFNKRFEPPDPDGTMSVAERTRRAEHARKSYFAELAARSAEARRKRADQC